MSRRDDDFEFNPTIETGIPIPSMSATRRGTKSQRMIAFFEKMKFGQSVVLPADYKQAYTNLTHALRKHDPGFGITKRTLPDGSFRLWKIPSQPKDELRDDHRVIKLEKNDEQA